MWGFTVVVAWLSGQAMAGTLDDSELRFCDWRFSGAVEAGDLAAFDAIPASPRGTTLCLDSTGGDMAEGLKILTRVRDAHIRTRVLPGHACQGACALIFLGGATEDGAGLVRFPHREIWAGARLGFSGAGAAVDTALDMVEGLFALKVTEEQGHRLLEDHLFLQILRHRGSDPYMIDTVGDAYLSNIPVMGVAAPDPIGAEQITHICDAVYLRYRLHDGTAGPLDTDFRNTAHSISNLRRNRIGPIRGAVAAGEDGTIHGYAGPYWAGSRYWQRECYVTIRPDDVAAYGGDNAALGITGIAVEFRDHGGADRDVAAFDPESWLSGTRLVGAYDVPPLLMHPFHARLDDLSPTDTAMAARAEGGPALPPPPPDFVRFDGMDLAGGDLETLSAVPTGEACLQACRETGECDGATYDRWNEICFLKDLGQSSNTLSKQPKSEVYAVGARIDALRPAQADPVILRRPGKGFFDRPAFYFQGQSFDDCATQCLEDDGCSGFNFVTETGACQVFDRPGEYFDRDGTEVGLKVQPF
ncbi:hypothetical protein ATO3_27610 [Marinibacterium profundimaris]|uniref:Apple domain-containing protein n=2 Tax=Marinibacterium profundimaris TaxID=1679460 RepID=A0A225NEP4_9RHOB|nr:hypothetical protein ATO3_27610 [Marinibacterium profundimaris]